MKFAQYITERYENATARRLSDVYGRWSKKKQDAFDYCERLMCENEGWELRIISANTYMFTATFEFVPKDSETGAVCIMYITPGKRKVVEWTRQI